ncbi:alpha-ketoacid dehydrogenase subunit beta [Roseomonas sp. PWR1]|uniref:Alpha-ketoacid dehydrogenase subunit beta n=1 Tax=Roseomonas nitratireducens TaxID=2820810 RepID=A0ABS4APM0_9PROT|nr:transketolase C-terminal domain-containing protein [Neoroseomonas nitratireducens]MBP0462776.1 alpha-ketoacid dehydrogenase subunit beta [Neoroseomonas nitratireducens]
MTRMSFAEATRRALADEMRRDPLVWALGEDLVQGGIFGQYKGLAEEFGPDRIVSTPISESTIMGAGLGAALCGTRPIVEMRIADFTLCAMDELVSQIAKVRYMFGGQGRAALVVRMPQGMWRNSAAQHSQCLEAWLTHIPGLVVAAPGTPADAAGLLKAAIRSDDPVVLMEPKNLWTSEGEVAEEIAPIPFGVARHAAAGDAATVVTWSATVPVVEQGARESGIACDVFDLRSLWPWDEAAVIASARRTRRLLVVHEAVTVSGFGAEVVARVVEALGPAGLAAVERLGAPRAPVPFSPPLEDSLRITPTRVADAIRRLAAR